MNLEQFLLAKIAEEACELGMEAHKASLFGLDSKSPISIETNLERIGIEFNDLRAVMELFNRYLHDEGRYVPYATINSLTERTEEKIRRVVSWLQVSEQLGRVTIPRPIPQWLSPYWQETT